MRKIGTPPDSKCGAPGLPVYMGGGGEAPSTTQPHNQNFIKQTPSYNTPAARLRLRPMLIHTPRGGNLETGYIHTRGSRHRATSPQRRGGGGDRDRGGGDRDRGGGDRDRYINTDGRKRGKTEAGRYLEDTERRKQWLLLDIST